MRSQLRDTPSQMVEQGPIAFPGIGAHFADEGIRRRTNRDARSLRLPLEHAGGAVSGDGNPDRHAQRLGELIAEGRPETATLGMIKSPRLGIVRRAPRHPIKGGNPASFRVLALLPIIGRVGLPSADKHLANSHVRHANFRPYVAANGERVPSPGRNGQCRGKSGLGTSRLQHDPA